jgi:hypothetical protein
MGRAGTECVALSSSARLATSCFTLSCSRGVVATYPCEGGATAGVCLPAAKLATGASLSRDRRTITLALNAPARAGKLPCAGVFGAATAAGLGAGAACEVVAAGAGAAAMAVRLTPVATILPGDNVTISPSQTALVDDLTGRPFTTATAAAGSGAGSAGPLRLVDADSPLPPAAVLTAPTVRAPGRPGGARVPPGPASPRGVAPPLAGAAARGPSPPPAAEEQPSPALPGCPPLPAPGRPPPHPIGPDRSAPPRAPPPPAQVFTRPCVAGAAAAVDLVLDAGLSSDPSGRPLAGVAWALASGSDPVLAAFVAAANGG